MDSGEGEKRVLRYNQSRGSCSKRKAISDTGLAVDSPNYRAFLASRGYIIKNTLGTGSYSKVKLASDLTGKHEKVAIKIVDTSRAPQDYQRKFMPRELEIWPRLDHPNLCKLHHIFKDTKRVYMIEEYAPRGDMLHYIQEKGAVIECRAKTWMLQIMDAVNYMHKCGLAHRDLKLENLLITDEWDLKICDFGFTKVVSKDLSQTYCGSKSYAAPEILRGQPYDPVKADVWALGVILYILVTAKMPYDETKSNKHLLEDMKAQNFKWHRYPSVSKLCRNAIHSMFKLEFESRDTIESLLKNNPWFKIPMQKQD